MWTSQKSLEFIVNINVIYVRVLFEKSERCHVSFAKYKREQVNVSLWTTFFSNIAFYWIESLDFLTISKLAIDI